MDDDKEESNVKFEPTSRSLNSSSSKEESSFEEPSDGDDDEEEVYEVLDKKPSPVSQPWEQIGIFFLGAKDDAPAEEPTQDVSLFDTFADEKEATDERSESPEAEKSRIEEQISDADIETLLQCEIKTNELNDEYGEPSLITDICEVIEGKQKSDSKTNTVRRSKKSKVRKRDDKKNSHQEKTSLVASETNIDVLVDDKASSSIDEKTSPSINEKSSFGITEFQSCVGFEVEGECHNATATETSDVNDISAGKAFAKRSGAYQFLNDLDPRLRVSYQLNEDLDCEESDSVSISSNEQRTVRSNSIRESISNLSDLDLKSVSDVNQLEDVVEVTPKVDRNDEMCCRNKKKKEVRLKCTTCGKRCHPSCQNLTKSQAKDVQNGSRIFWCTDCLLDSVVASRDRTQSNCQSLLSQKSWRNSEEAGLRRSCQSSEIGFVGCRLPLEKAELDERLKRQCEDKEMNYEKVMEFLAGVPRPEEFFLYHEVRPHSPTRKGDIEAEESETTETEKEEELKTVPEVFMSQEVIEDEDKCQKEKATLVVERKVQRAKRSKPLKKKSVTTEKKELAPNKDVNTSNFLKFEPQSCSRSEDAKLSPEASLVLAKIFDQVSTINEAVSSESVMETKSDVGENQNHVNRKRSSMSTASDDVNDAQSGNKTKLEAVKNLKSWHSSEPTVTSASEPKKHINNRRVSSKAQPPLKEPTEHFRRNGYYEILAVFTEQKSNIKKPLGKEQTKNFILKLEREIFRFSLRSSHLDGRVLTDRYDAKIRQICNILRGDPVTLNDTVQGRMKLASLVELKDKAGKLSIQADKQDNIDLFQVSSDQKISKVVKKEVALLSNTSTPTVSSAASVGSHSDESSQSSVSDFNATWRGALKFENFCFDVLAFSLDCKTNDPLFECPPDLEMSYLQPMSEFWRMAESFSRKTLLNKQLSILQLKAVQKSTEYSMFTSKLESQQLYGRVRNCVPKNRIYIAPITRHDTKKPLMNGFSIDASLSKSEISLFVFVISVNAFGSLQQDFLSSPNECSTASKFETDSVLAAVACDIDKKQKLENEVELTLPNLFEPPPITSSYDESAIGVKKEPFPVGNDYRLSVSSEPDFAFDNFPEMVDDDDVLPPDVVFEPPVCLSPDRIKREKSPDEDPRILPYFSPVDDGRKSCDQLMPLAADDSRVSCASVKHETSCPTKTIGIGIELEKPPFVIETLPSPVLPSKNMTPPLKEEPKAKALHVTKDIPVELPQSAILPMDPRNASDLYLNSDQFAQSVYFAAILWEKDSHSVVTEKVDVKVEVKEERMDETDSCELERAFNEPSKTPESASPVAAEREPEDEPDTYYDERLDSTCSEENFYNLVQEQKSTVPLRPEFWPQPRGYLLRQAVQIRGNQRFVMSSQRIPIRPLMNNQGLPQVPAAQYAIHHPPRAGINPRTGVRYPVVAEHSLQNGAVIRPNPCYYPCQTRPPTINYGSPCYEPNVPTRPVVTYGQPRLRPVASVAVRVPVVNPRFNSGIRPVHHPGIMWNSNRPRYPFQPEGRENSRSPIRTQGHLQKGNVPAAQMHQLSEPFDTMPPKQYESEDFDPSTDHGISQLDTKNVRERLSAQQNAQKMSGEPRFEMPRTSSNNEVETDHVNEQNLSQSVEPAVTQQGNTSNENPVRFKPEASMQLSEIAISESTKSKNPKRFQKDYLQASENRTANYAQSCKNQNEQFNFNNKRFERDYPNYRNKHSDRKYKSTYNRRYQNDSVQQYYGNEKNCNSDEHRFQTYNNDYGRNKFDVNTNNFPQQQRNMGRITSNSLQRKDQSWKQLSPQSGDNDDDCTYDYLMRKSSRGANPVYSQSSSSRNSEERWDNRSCSRERKSGSKEKRRKRDFSIDSRNDSRGSSMSREDIDLSFNSRQSERKFRKFERPKADIEESFITAKKKKKRHRDLSPKKKNTFNFVLPTEAEDVSSTDVVSTKIEERKISVAEGKSPFSSKVDEDLEEGECSE